MLGSRLSLRDSWHLDSIPVLLIRQFSISVLISFLKGIKEDIGCSLNMYNTDAHISARTEELPIRQLVNFLPTLNASFSICFCLLLVAFWSSNTEEEAALILLRLAWPASTNNIKSILYEPNVWVLFADCWLRSSMFYKN